MIPHPRLHVGINAAMRCGILCAVLGRAFSSPAAPAPASQDELDARDALGERIPGARVLWVRANKIYHSSIKDFSEQKITGSETEGRPRWSPDGSRIIFHRKNGDTYDVWMMQADFSGEQKIVPGGHTADWADHGNAVTAIIHTAGASELEGTEVVKYDVSTGDVATIHDVEANGSNGWPLAQTAELHPDGRYILTFSRMDNHHSYIIDLVQQTYLYNSEMWRGDCGPGWAPDGSYFTTTARTGSRPALKTGFTWDTDSLPESTHFLGMNTSTQYYHHGHRISSDGEWAVGGILWKGGSLSGNREIYVWEIADPNRDDHAVRLTFDTDEDQSPSLFVGSSAPGEPAMGVSPAAVSFRASTGGADPDDQIVSIGNTNPGGGILETATAAGTASWLSVSVDGSGNAQTIVNSVLIDGLPDGTYHDTVEVSIGNATNSPQSYTVILTLTSMREPDSIDGLVAGLNVRYYELSSPDAMPDFNALDEFRVDSVGNVEYPGTDGAFATSGRADNVGAVFSGYVSVNRDDRYTFYVESDDGAVLYIGGVKVVDGEGPHGMQESHGTIGLKQGSHPFRLEYFEGSSQAGLIVQWDRPGTAKHVIPVSSLFRLPSKEVRFTLLGPLEGDVWQTGTTRHIQWTAENADEAVIEISYNDGISFEDSVWLVQKGEAGWGDFPWIVPDRTSTECRIRVGEYQGEGAATSGKFEITDKADVIKRERAGNAWFRVQCMKIPSTRHVEIMLPDHTAPSDIAVYDVQGNAVALFSGIQKTRVVWDARLAASGIYVIRVCARGLRHTGRIVLH
ncbi:MAG: hypothetical protein GF418_06930 [Chitinivibrionales bacterium]|nr:hypothetical protein [Chitinivibrionales bacterium]MBD3395344.1 hypothetical protein [Chitinivibrionales bacterium]